MTPINIKSFQEAKEIVKKKGFIRIQHFEYWVLKERPEGIPAHPWSAYARSGWKGWGDFLGSKWMTYEEAKAYLVKAGIRTTIDFRNWTARPARLPSDPQKVYGEEFISWRDFLSNPDLRESPFTKKILTYDEARAIVRAAGIKSRIEYRKWKKPPGIPYDPVDVYKNKGWRGWAHYLGLED